MILPAIVLALHEAQFGLVTRAQLTGAGIRQVTIDTWVARGKLVVVHRGVYRLPGTPTSRRQLVLAAMLRCSEDARAGGWSACGLHRLEGFELREQPWILVGPGQRIRRVTFTVQRTTLAPDDLTTIDAIPTVTAQRALIDLASRVQGKRGCASRSTTPAAATCSRSRACCTGPSACDVTGAPPGSAPCSPAA